MDLRKRHVGICLSSGLFGFFAHEGFKQAIDELGVVPRALTGCSAGALLGGLWAAGLEADKIRETILEVGLRELIDLPRPRELLSGPFGIARGRAMEQRLAQVLPVQRFEECPIPFAVAAFDLALAKLKIIDRGPLARGIRASASLPGLFLPTSIDGHPCWDGALAEKAPLASLVDREDIDTILICSLAREGRALPPKSFVGCFRLALDAMVFESDRVKLREARKRGKEIFVIAPKVPRCGPLKMREGPRIIEIARDETLRIIETEDFGCEELS
jgi:NTE family protein